MGLVQPIGIASDRVMAALISGLEIEFGRGAAEGLAARFLDAEDCDFCWEARQSERWLGTYEGHGDDDLELDRVAIFGLIDGRWFMAICIVDGDGRAHGMTGRRSFGSRREAEIACSAAR